VRRSTRPTQRFLVCHRQETRASRSDSRFCHHLSITVKGPGRRKGPHKKHGLSAPKRPWAAWRKRVGIERKRSLLRESTQ
jgi:hypothetical protein